MTKCNSIHFFFLLCFQDQKKLKPEKIPNYVFGCLDFLESDWVCGGLVAGNC
jgi:hypothetical protein